MVEMVEMAVMATMSMAATELMVRTQHHRLVVAVATPVSVQLPMVLERALVVALLGPVMEEGLVAEDLMVVVAVVQQLRAILAEVAVELVVEPQVRPNLPAVVEELVVAGEVPCQEVAKAENALTLSLQCTRIM